MNAYCRFYIVRHGQTDWNVKKLIQGQKDIPLNSQGRLQAEAAAKLLRSIHFDKIISSDLSRAKHTAEVIAIEKKLAVETTRLLRERQLGIFVGKPLSLLKTIDEELSLLSHEGKQAYKKTHNIEEIKDMIGRFIVFLRETAVSSPGKSILVVTHAGMIRVLLVHLGFAETKQLPVGNIRNASYVIVDSDGVEFFIKETVGIEKTS